MRGAQDCYAPFQETIMIEKKASIHWEGAGKNGKGQVSTETGALKDYPYGLASRFADDRKGTNPEEILGAAHAACFTMFFAVSCEKAGINVGSIDTTATVRLAKEGEGFKIDRIALVMEATVPGLDQAKFDEIAESSKKNCPVSKALAAVPEITLDARLRG
jgi:lipoyl-dependent peroxiredoxin